MLRQIRKKKLGKKGISPMIGYVLLISFAVIIAAAVYLWVKTYVPQEDLECPDGISLMIKEITCEDDGAGGYDLSINLKNTGRFNVNGYFITGINNSDKQELIEISKYFSVEAARLNPGVGFFPGILKAGKESGFQIFKSIENISAVEITPMKEIEVKNKLRTVSCGYAKIKEDVSCV